MGRSTLTCSLFLALAACAGTSPQGAHADDVTTTPPRPDPTPVVADSPPSAPEVPDVVIPAGSADYSRMLGLVVAWKKGKTTFDGLKAQIVAAKLPPHGLGCGYLMMVPPPPPPGIEFVPGLMPRDWVGTFGEVAMTHFGGPLSLEEYEALHQAAHGTLPGFPNCQGR